MIILTTEYEHRPLTFSIILNLFIETFTTHINPLTALLSILLLVAFLKLSIISFNIDSQTFL